MPLIPITDGNDERISVYFIISENALFRINEPAPGIFIAESPKVIRRAIDAGYEIESILINEDEMHGEARELINELINRESVCVMNNSNTSDSSTFSLPIYQISSSLYEKYKGYNMTGGMLAAIRRKTSEELSNSVVGIMLTSNPQEDANNVLPCNSSHVTSAISVSDIMSTSPCNSDTHMSRGSSHRNAFSRIVVLDDIENPTNVGAIFRNAAALGIDCVLVTKDSADPLYRRALRVSMGTALMIPWAYVEKDYIDKLKAMGYKTVAMALKDNSRSIDDPRIKAEEKLAILMGNEGIGLSDETLDKTDYTVMIPMENGVDSLNVSCASVLAFWELTHQSLSQSDPPQSQSDPESHP